MVLVTPRPAQNNQPLSTSRIRQVLEYVAPGEVRVLAAEGSEDQLLATIAFRSAQYTRNPVEYLSLAELAVALAQAAQLLVELQIEAQAPDLQESLAIARAEHRVYFGRFDVAFHKKYPARDYPLWLGLSHVASRRGTWYGHIQFAVSDYMSGSFSGIVERLGVRQ